MNSCLYQCHVMHHRLTPKVHHFRHRLFMFALDLDEVDEVASRISLFSRNRANLYSFRDRDHMTLPGLVDATTKENLVAWLAGEGVQLPAGARITLVTLPRVLGYVFNPVSFYFCAAAGTPLCAVAEVGNTFGEMKPYLLRQASTDDVFRLSAPKHFYVSPFSPLDLTFEFALRVPDAKLNVHIGERAADAPVLFSALTGTRVPLTTANLAWFAIKYPLLTLKVIGLIHLHAALLWLKGLPWHRKAANPSLQRDLLGAARSVPGTIP